MPGVFTKIPVDEEGEKRRLQLAGVAVDMKIEVWDSEVAGQGLPLGDPSPIGFSPLMGSFLASLRSRCLQGPKWRSVEEEFPHIYAHGCVLKDVCSDCTSFVADVVCSSRKSVDVLNATPRRSRQTQSLYVPNTRTLNFQ